jgi:hypothetical protein
LNPKLKRRLIFILAIPAVLAAAIFGGIMIHQDNLRRDTRVVTYPAPEGIAPSADTSVTVNGQPVFVYETAVNDNRMYEEYPKLSKTPVAYFDFMGQVDIQVIVPGAMAAVVRPLSLGIRPEVRDGVIRFTLRAPAQLTVEVNGGTARALHLFANPLETDVPDPNGENVIWLGPGIHDEPVVRLKSGQTLYIAGGAVLRGKVVAEKAENIRVTGRGIIDGSVFDRWTQRTVPADFRLCKHVRVDGVIFLDPAAWTLNTFACSDVLIENVKIVSARPNGDGITTQSCQNLTARDCFVRSWDDSLVVKNYGDGTSHDILFQNIVVWTDLAQSCEIGYETKGPEMYDIAFEGITVLHNFHKPVLSIHNSDQAYVHDIRYKDITVEDARMGEGDGANFLIDLTVAESQWTTSKERGRIENVTYQNINVLGGRFTPSRFMGFDAEHGIKNVSIENLSILGKRITTKEEGRFDISGAVEGVAVK